MSLFDNYVVTVVVLRNHFGYILGAWINCCFSSNLFCAEIEATIQNFDIAMDLKLDKDTFEGDSLLVILALHGLNQFGDWRVQHLLDKGHSLLQKFPFWFVNFINCSCNSCAHKLAKWARSFSIIGNLDVTTRPPEVLCDCGEPNGI